MKHCKKKILYHHRTQAIAAEGHHIRGMVRAFEKLNFEVDIVGPPGIDVWIEPISETNQNAANSAQLLKYLAAYSPQWLFGISEILYNLFSFFILKRKLVRENYFFLYDRYAIKSFVPALLASRFQLPYVTEVNDAVIIERSRPTSYFYMSRTIENYVLRRAYLIVTISTVFKELLIRHYDLPPEKIIVLPNAIDPESFKVEEPREVLKKKLKINTRFIIGNVGAFLEWHGLAFLVESTFDLIRQYEITLLFVGDGPVREQIEILAKEKGVSEFVKFTGFVPHQSVPDYINLMDICIIPDSNMHCSPMKLFEFMVMAKPILLPDYQPLVETVEEGCEALFFKKRDRGSLRNRMIQLLENSKLRQVLGHNAQQKVLKKYTWRSNAMKVIKAIENHGN